MYFSVSALVGGVLASASLPDLRDDAPRALAISITVILVMGTLLWVASAVHPSQPAIFWAVATVTAAIAAGFIGSLLFLLACGSIGTIALAAGRSSIAIGGRSLVAGLAGLAAGFIAVWVIALLFVLGSPEPTL